MRVAASIVIAAVALLGCDFRLNNDAEYVLNDPGPESERQESLKAAEYFLILLDDDRVDESYEKLSPFLRDQTGIALWRTAIGGIRGVLGAPKSRALESLGYGEDLPDSPPGRYFIFEFATEFESGSVTEKVVIKLEPAGPKIGGYFVEKSIAQAMDD